MPSCKTLAITVSGLNDLREIDPDQRRATNVLEVPNGLTLIVEFLARLRSVRRLREDVGQLDVAQGLRREEGIEALEKALSVLDVHALQLSQTTGAVHMGDDLPLVRLRRFLSLSAQPVTVISASSDAYLPLPTTPKRLSSGRSG